MQDEAKDIVEFLRKLGHAPRLEGTRGCVQLVIDGVGAFRVEIDGGDVRVLDGVGRADATIECDAGDFVRILRGEQNLLTALLQGRIGVTGDLQLLSDVNSGLPPPPERGEELTRRLGKKEKAA
jgi:putative sterol carrier protein